MDLALIPSALVALYPELRTGHTFCYSDSLVSRQARSDQETYVKTEKTSGSWKKMFKLNKIKCKLKILNMSFFFSAFKFRVTKCSSLSQNYPSICTESPTSRKPFSPGPTSVVGHHKISVFPDVTYSKDNILERWWTSWALQTKVSIRVRVPR